MKIDKAGRLLYDEELHKNQNRSWLMSDLAYLCGMWKKRKIRDIALCLERTDAACITKVNYLKNKGEFEKYRKIYTGMEV